MLMMNKGNTVSNITWSKRHVLKQVYKIVWEPYMIINPNDE